MTYPLTTYNSRSEGATPYKIPAGGSNEIGTWGYIEAFRELMEQVRREREMLLISKT